ncbi:MAG TPA: hypothetical protein VNU46_03850 [Gemmatimonadaceae bacterium]|jgi:hypothetical protein|nr:hypothetical protein [Gemmatimonadaceae bacterium]
MKPFMTAVLLLAGTLACGPRPVDVQTGQAPATEVSLHVTNNLSQAVNVYVVNGGSDVFLKQVNANSDLSMTVPGIPSGTAVTLKATAADGSRTYTRENVTLSGTYEWQVP